MLSRWCGKGRLIYHRTSVDGSEFVLSYATFRYNTSKGEFSLDKYSEAYINQFAESQDESETIHFRVEKNKYSFEDFTEEYFIVSRNDYPNII